MLLHLIHLPVLCMCSMLLLVLLFSEMYDFDASPRPIVFSMLRLEPAPTRQWQDRPGDHDRGTGRR
jgi:hypothetical protein